MPAVNTIGRMGAAVTLLLLAACSRSYAPGGKGLAPAREALALAPPPPPAGSVAQLREPSAQPNTEAYDKIDDNPFLDALDNPLSTFSIDVDTASYANVRRFLHEGQLPPKDAVRIEELVNYFPYDYPAPSGDAPFALSSELSAAPWNPEHQVLHLGLQAKKLDARQMPRRNLVFLLDVSGSMSDPNKLPLLKRSLSELAKTLTENDRVAMVVYAGSSGLALAPTRGNDEKTIVDALERLEAGGSTNGAEGIELAYRTARQNFDVRGVNRVILATDGDFNVGVSSEGELVRMIERERQSGVYLTVLGLGMGNLKDSTLEKLADRGNGNYAYIDTLSEARKVLIEQSGSTFVTVAEDVKIQVEFNPEVVAGYRLIGYENRLLRAEDFNDDRKDAGEVGAGHSVTALYEIVPAGAPVPGAAVDALKYRKASASSAAAHGGELATLKLRYKQPHGADSRLLGFTIASKSVPAAATSDAFRFSAAVAGFGMLLRESPFRSQASYGLVRQLAEGALGSDTRGYRHEFLTLVGGAEKLAGRDNVVAR